MLATNHNAEGNAAQGRAVSSTMSEPTTTTTSGIPGKITKWIVRVLCMVALSVSSYLAWSSFQATEVYGCGGASVFDCGHVLSSRWAKLFGVPVSVPAVALYASLLAILAFMTAKAPERFLKLGWSAVTFGSMAAGLAALWFIGLQVFVLKHLCPYCLVAHACGLVLAGIVLYHRPAGNRLTSILAGGSVAAVAVLVTGQMMTEPPPTYYVETYEGDAAVDVSGLSTDEAPGMETAGDDVFAPPGGIFEPPGVAFEPPDVADDEQPADDSAPTSPDNTVDVERSEDRDNSAIAEEAAPQSRGTDPSVASSLLLLLPHQWLATSQLLWQANQSKTATAEGADSGEAAESADRQSVKKEEPDPPIVSVARNKIRLDARHWPLLGKSNAKYIFVEMFDYTCPHCRNTHGAVKGAMDRYGDDLAIIALPVPLNRSCNRYASGGAQHTHACEIAKLAVAVWRTKPSSYREFHDWLFQSDSNVQPNAARRKAEALIGADALREELKRPYADQYIAKHVELYNRVGAGQVPKLMFPNQTVTGAMTSTSTLVSYIESQLVNQ